MNKSSSYLELSYSGQSSGASTRREFLKRSAVVAASTLAITETGKSEESKPVPTVDFCGHKVTRLIAGANPIIIGHHGNVTDNLFRIGKLDLVRNFLDKVHDMGFPTGISTHNRSVIVEAEEEGWPIDFYQACFYRQSHNAEEYQKEINVVPVGEAYLSTDPAAISKVIRQVSKPCLVLSS